MAQKKRLVVCCDGTWNAPDQQDEGVVCPSNAALMARALVRLAPGDVAQQVYYDTGVGTRGGWFDKIAGGAFGWGLSDKVKAAYSFLIDNYDEGDEIFLFGFSRGAYTARSTVGLIRNSGLLLRRHKDRVNAAYNLYRRRDDDSRPSGNEAEIFRRMYSHPLRGDDPTVPGVFVRCIGVWDTVGALGIPLDSLRVFNRGLQFHDVQLSSIVDNAFHALAIDERRGPFRPALWAQSAQAHAQGQRIEQVWFPGVHTDVGGGRKDDSLSSLAFLWMRDRAAECGLAFNEQFVAEKFAPDPLGGEIKTTRTGIYRLLPPYERPMGKGTPLDTPGERKKAAEQNWLLSEDGSRALGAEAAHWSAKERFEDATAPRYAPDNLRTYLEQGGIVTAKNDPSLPERLQ